MNTADNRSFTRRETEARITQVPGETGSKKRRKPGCRRSEGSHLPGEEGGEVGGNARVDTKQTPENRDQRENDGCVTRFFVVLLLSQHTERTDRGNSCTTRKKDQWRRSWEPLLFPSRERTHQKSREERAQVKEQM